MGHELGVDGLHLEHDGPAARDPNGRREFTGAQDLSPDQGRAGQQSWNQPDAAERAEATETFPAYPADDA